MHTALTVVYLTYPPVVSDIDIRCSLVNKVRHYIIIAFLSCEVQGSVLLKRMQQNVMFTQNYHHSWLQSTSVTTHGPYWVKEWASTYFGSRVQTYSWGFSCVASRLKYFWRLSLLARLGYLQTIRPWDIVCQWEGQQCLNKFSNHIWKSSIKSRSSSAGSTLVESSNWKVFYTQQGQTADIMPATPPEPGWFAVHSTPSRLLSRSTYQRMR